MTDQVSLFRGKNVLEMDKPELLEVIEYLAWEVQDARKAYNKLDDFYRQYPKEPGGSNG